LKNIHISSQPDPGVFTSLSQYSNLAVLADENTFKYCYPLLKGLLPAHKLIRIKSGEKYKTLETCQHIWQQLTNWGFDRHSCLINLGGGVITDMGAFCAGTYKRGIDFINIPTTLLAQVDAAIGGKTGIDFNGFKNHIGMFREAAAVWISTGFLTTLPQRELRSGFAEVIKHCLIADAEAWNRLRKLDLEDIQWPTYVEHSIRIKSAITTADPQEKGERKLLNFGHTIGHALETYFLDKPRRQLLHGEAVAAGMICEAYISYRKKMLSEEGFAAIEEFIYSTYGKVKLTPEDIDHIAPLARQDKKNKAGAIRCVLLEQPGKAVFDITITLADIKKALQFYAE
jgi:3-dehydroquinate synthase